MRLLVVGHSYMLAFNQQKYVAMKQQREGLELRILAPRTISHLFMRNMRELSPGLDKDDVVDIRELFGRSHMTYMLDPIRFTKVLREFQPHRVHIEEDPYSAVGVESVFLTRLICPLAKISFFIWDNLARVPRFPLNVIKRKLNDYSLSSADLVVCGNRDGEVLLREKKGYRGRTAVLPQLGVTPDFEISPKPSNVVREKFHIPKELPLIGFVGRLIPEKGVSLMFEALLRIKHLKWSVLILGSGPMEDEITSMWKTTFGDRLVFCKAVPHADVPEYMRALDVLILPSYGTPYWKEQFGLVLAQAMMLGVPCLGSSSGAIPEVIGPGGLIFTERDVDDFARNLERLLIDPDLRRSLAESAKQFAREQYSHAAVAKAYLREFDLLESA